MYEAALVKRDLLEQLLELPEYQVVYGVSQCFPYKFNYPIPEKAAVRMRSAGITHTRFCGHSHACPTCTPRYMAERREEIAYAMRKWKEQSGFFYFHTLTQQTSIHVETASLYEGLVNTWGAMARRSRYSSNYASAGSPSFVKVIEESLSSSGWHVHLHVLWFFPAETNVAAAEAFLDLVGKLWSDCAQKNTQLGASEHSQLWEAVTDTTSNFAETMSRYVSKLGFLNLTEGRSELLEKRNWEPFEVLRIFLYTGQESFGNAWVDYQLGSQGKRRVVMSKGIRRLLDQQPLGHPAKDEAEY